MAIDPNWWKRDKDREFAKYMAREFGQSPAATRRNQDQGAREDRERAAKQAKRR